MESDANAIQICVRVRPWHPEKEAPFVIQPSQQTFFLGDGNFALSPRRPVGSGSVREVVEVMDHRQLDFDKPEPGSETRRGQPGAKRYKNRRYIFDHVFQKNATQEDVFEKTAKPLLSGVLDGYNATVFAYGATGCGKTHTISGTAEDPGVTIRIMRELFEMIDASKDEFDTYIELSMVEIYNENIRDLLNDDFPACPTGGLKLLENEKERVTVDRVTLKRPQSADEVMALVLLGNQRRSTSYTESNSVSSRSHAVLQINVGRNSKGHEVDFEQAVVRQCTSSATLSIIDLAGSERAAATRNMGARMKEGANINKSLLALSSCISALCQRPIRGMRPHVPYRNSKLTRMLKFSLGGNCRTVMIVCVSPSSKDIEDTHNTLVWADKAKNVSTKITRNTAGVQVSVQQYLTTISQQEARIKYLESKVEEGTQALSAYAKKKLESARADARAALVHLRKEFEAAVPFIVEGAKKRALWDQAEMRSAALKGRLVQLEADDSVLAGDKDVQKGTLTQIVEEESSLFADNRRVQAIVQQESIKATALNRLIQAASTKSFGDALDKPEEEAFRLKVKIQEMELAASVASAREKGYREGAQQYARSRADTAAFLARVASTLSSQTKALQNLDSEISDPSLALAIKELQELSTTVASSTTSLFTPDANDDSPMLPPMPKSRKVPSLAASEINGMGQPSRRRLSTAPSAPVRSSLRGGRLSIAPLGTPSRGARLSIAPLGTPRRQSLVKSLASPAKRSTRPFKVGQIKGRTPKKTFRWKDEAGEGEISDLKTAPDAPVFTSPETGEESSLPIVHLDEAGSGGSSDEWRDEPDGRESSSSPELVMRPPSRPLMGMMGPPVPAWKRNKMMLGKAVGGLTSLGEERESSASPEPGPSKKLPGLGAPSRPPARASLNARHQVPSVATSSPSSSAFSNLLRPTIASRSRSSINIRAQAENDAKAIGIGSPPRRVVSNGRMLPPSSVTKGKRRTSKGPYKAGSERRKSRGGLMVTSDSMSMSISGHGLPQPSSISPALNSSKRPVDGLPGPSSSTSTLTQDENRRSSVMAPTSSSSMRSFSGTGALGAPGSSGISGPRASLAPPTTSAGAGSSRSPTLATKPSLSRLNTASSSNMNASPVGDTSRAAWR